MNNEKLKVSLKTFGCQMNEYDGQAAAGLLEHSGFELTADEKKADVVLMNTCSVREHAEERVYGRLGMLGKQKRTNPNLIVGLMGCMVEEHKEKLFKRFPQLDLMVGTRNIKELPSLIEEVRKSRRQVSQIKQDGISIEYTDLIKRTSLYYAWLPIMTGCDKVCTYCIVPMTRGTEVSMPAREVYREASRLVSEGVKWITLLGQNVNSYNGTAQPPPSLRGGRQADEAISEIASTSIGTLSRNDGIRFPALLEMLCEIEGLERICFTTSHPHDATEKLFQVIARNPKISRRFHLPLQTASDRILKRMKRLHTYQEYKSKIERMRELIPDISVTTDIITGFSGETEADHKATCAALEEIAYDSAFIYKYSTRPGTPAAKLTDDVPVKIKELRHHELFELQRQVTKKNNQPWLGREITVFAEAVSAKDSRNIIARTDQDKKVVFCGEGSIVGQFVKTKLTGLRHETFLGVLV